MAQPTVTIKDSKGTTIYHQVLEDDKSIGKLINEGMKSPAGSNFTLEVVNNGHTMPFPVDFIEVGKVVRLANNILVREKSAATE